MVGSAVGSVVWLWLVRREGGGGEGVKPIYLSFALLWVVFFSSHVSGRLTCFN